MSTELLPCPFCGGVAAIERLGTPRQSQIVACEDCGCLMESGDVGAPHSWNRRVHPTKPPSGLHDGAVIQNGQDLATPQGERT